MPDGSSSMCVFGSISSRVLDAQFVRLGAQTRDLPFSDVFAALEKKMVDATENTPSNIYSKKFYTVQEHMTVSNHGYLGYLVLTNETFWSGLPEGIRKILEDTLNEVTDWERQIAEEQNERDMERIVKSGQIEVYFLSEQERTAWREALLPVHKMFLPDIEAKLLQNSP